MIEVWKEINGFSDYMVSSYGRIKSLKFGKERILKLGKNKYGYLQFILYKNNKKYTKTIHRLVLETFNPIENMDKLEGNHKDGNKENNRLDNLEWCTYYENRKHAIENGLINNKDINNPNYGNHYSEETKRKQSEKMRGENNPNSILTEEKVIEIWKYLKEGILTHKEIGEKFGFARPTISNIKNGRSWKHIKIKESFK